MKVTYYDTDGDEVDTNDYVHQYGERWYVARWDETLVRFVAPLVKKGRVPLRGAFAYAQSIGKLTTMNGVYAYSNRGNAIDAALRTYGWSKERR